jgi:ectoine hydroxylase-related dioxygenase (phytanoyl-CoA dioxygenase family)
MKPFSEIPASELTSVSLADEMKARGYLLIRGLLPTEDVARMLGEITRIVSAAGWLLPDESPAERVADVGAACGDPDPAFKRVYEQIFNLQAFHAFAHHPALRQVMQQLVGRQLLVHPKPIGRLIFPNCDRLVIHAHQDHRSVDGDAESFTAWMPLHDCPVELGPLEIMEGSHVYGLQGIDPTTGIIAKETARGGEWVGGPIHAGDVLIFHSLTVHAATPNVSNQLRVSMDCRFQDARRPVNPANFVFPGSGNEKSWETTYAGWPSEELKYFWKAMPLVFEPSRSRLAELAATEADPRMRARYARILSQLEAQDLG